MVAPLHFAHITDVHITDPDESLEALGLDGPYLLSKAIDHLNQMKDLDFVLVTGDVLNHATQVELDDFLNVMDALEYPFHFVPGNHDGFIHPSNPTALRPVEVVSAIDPRLSDYNPEANSGFWSREIKPGIQMIGLDSRIANDWGGVINPQQLDWLRRELDTSSYQDLVIVAIHHPVHKLGPHNEREWWDKFVLSNGRIVERLFDIYSNVQLVISGHHHCNHISLRSHRMHIVTAALSSYPCAYRTIRMKHTPDGWEARIQTHTAADEGTLGDALALMMESDSAKRFDPYDPAAWPTFCLGTEKDQAFDGIIEGDSRY